MPRLSLNFRKKSEIFDTDQAIRDDISNITSHRHVERNLNERHNGFDWKPSGQQVGVIIYFITANVLALAVLYPSLISHAKDHSSGSFMIFLSSSVGVMFLICSCLTVYLTYVCTAACPTDPIVQQQRIFRKHNLDYDSGSNRDTKDDMYCNVCNLIVQGRTKHCAQCNRCCAQFDHHCVWLNNCIGIENYKNFRRLIFWFLLFNLFSLALITITAIFGLLSSDSTKISLPVKITVFV